MCVPDQKGCHPDPTCCRPGGASPYAPAFTASLLSDLHFDPGRFQSRRSFSCPCLPNKPLQARHSWLGDRFPPRSHIDANGQPLAYVHFEHEAGQADGDPSLTRDEAR